MLLQLLHRLVLVRETMQSLAQLQNVLSDVVLQWFGEATYGREDRSARPEPTRSSTPRQSQTE